MSHIPTPTKVPRATMQPPRAVAAAPHQELSDFSSQRNMLLVLGSLVFLLIAAYWDMLGLTSAAWNEGLYSHGWLIPLFAIVLLLLRWNPYRQLPKMDRSIGFALIGAGVISGIVAWLIGNSTLGLLSHLPAALGIFLVIGGPFLPVSASERWIGLALLAGGLGIRLFAAEYGINPVDQLSFLPAIFGVFMLVGGMHVIRWAWPALFFLIFMFQLPTRLERPVLGGLQKLASICSTFVLQTLGMSAFRQGNLISIPGSDLNIADACSGLRMATIFGAMAVAMVFLVERPWWDKFVILLSAIPIALLVNIIRITVTGLLYWAVGPENNFAQKLGHDWAGYFMMPLALGFLWLELQILERLTVPVDSVRLRVGGARGASPIPAR